MSAAGADSALAVGTEIGPYRVSARLPGGAYRAVRGATRVAISVGSAERWRDAALHLLRVTRRIDELAHPGIAPIVDRGVLPDRRPWIAAELPSGMTLCDLISRRAMPAREAISLVHDLAGVLAAAHGRGLVHGALRLRAIVLATGPRRASLCITDWGLTPDDQGVFGAPEGSTGEHAVDVYALGVIAYRSVTGRFPRGPGGLAGVPGSLAALITRMLERDPAARPTAAEARDAAGELLAATAPAEHAPPARHFASARWTPAPPFAITSEEFTFVSGEIDAPA